MGGLQLIFRYTGRFDWTEMYHESKSFFEKKIPSELYFTETKYQHKGTKIEVSWRILHNYDAYHQIKYKIEFKCIKPKTVVTTVDGVEKALVEGALRVWIGMELIENYDDESPAGKKILFPGGNPFDKEGKSWLMAIYKKFTWRDRWDLVEDIGVFTCHDFLDFLKQKTAMYADGYASIWEPG